MQTSLTKTQRQLLRKVREGGVMLPSVLGQTGITPALLTRWLRRGYFRKALRGARLDLRQMTWLDLELLARAAVRMLQEMLLKPGKRSLVLMLLCLAILSEYDRVWRRYHPRRAGKKARVEEPTDLCHPDAKDREEELLAILENRST
jgi:hypothetical protein